MTEKLTNQLAGMLSGTMRDHDAILRKIDDEPTLDRIPEPRTVGFKRLTSDAVLPTKAHETDSGFDLYASEDVIIEPGETAVVPTGIAVQLPAGTEAQVRPRSGVTSKTKLRVQLGTIDNEYRGDVGVIVDNINHRDCLDDGEFTYSPWNIAEEATVDWGHYAYGSYLVRKGDRIAQLAVQYLPQVQVAEVDGDLTDTARGSGGFGSSGVREDE